MALPTDEQIIEQLQLRRERRWSIYDHPNLIRSASVIVFLLLWEFFGRETDPILLSYPTAVADAFLKLIASGELIKQLAVSLSALAVGFIASLVLGVALGLVLGMSRTAEAFFEPAINALYATPQVALTPLLMMWLGLGFSVKVTVVFLFAFFPILINTASGAKNVSAAMVEVARAYLARPREILFKVICPAALPFIMAGVRIAIGRALVGMMSRSFSRRSQVWALCCRSTAIFLRRQKCLSSSSYWRVWASAWSDSLNGSSAGSRPGRKRKGLLDN